MNVRRPPLAETKAPQYVVFVDESGDHGHSIDLNYPVFVLMFCIVEREHYVRQAMPLVTDFKFRSFGHDQVVLHERDIRKARRPFQMLLNPDTRATFMEGLNRIVTDTEMTLVAAVIDKRRLRDQYTEPANPYELAMEFGLERVYRFLLGRDGLSPETPVVVERRGRREDEQLELAFRRVCDGLNALGRELPFRIVFAHKHTNCTGLQIADLTARPVGLRVLRPDQPNRAFTILEPKLRRSTGGRVEGYGVKVFP